MWCEQTAFHLHLEWDGMDCKYYCRHRSKDDKMFQETVLRPIRRTIMNGVRVYDYNLVPIDSIQTGNQWKPTLPSISAFEAGSNGHLASAAHKVVHPGPRAKWKKSPKWPNLNGQNDCNGRTTKSRCKNRVHCQSQTMSVELFTPYSLEYCCFCISVKCLMFLLLLKCKCYLLSVHSRSVWENWVWLSYVHTATAHLMEWALTGISFINCN